MCGVAMVIVITAVFAVMVATVGIGSARVGQSTGGKQYHG